VCKSGKVEYSCDLIATTNKASRQLSKVQPLETVEIKVVERVVNIETVNEENNSVHRNASGNKKTQAHRSLGPTKQSVSQG